MNIKINAQHINNLSAARYYAVFADFMSFNINPQSANYVSVATIKNCMGWVAGVRGVLQAGTMPLAAACEVALSVGIDVLETDLLLTPPELEIISGGVSIVQNVRVADYIGNWGGLKNRLVATQKYSAYHILNLGDISVQDIDIVFFNSLNKEFNIFYNFELQAHNFEATIKVLTFLEPFGICLPNIEELEAGVCDFELVNNAVEFLDNRF